MDKNHENGLDEEDKPCRACSDFKTWAKQQNKATLIKPNTDGPTPPPPPPKPSPECPLDKVELGNSTWGLLHSMASYYPDKPTQKQADNMCKFFHIFAQFYPCEPCALDFQEDIKKHPPRTSSRKHLAQWLCERHNTVNIKLDKPVFDCRKVHERWRYGWADGSCD